MNFEDCNNVAEIAIEQNPFSMPVCELATEYQKLVKSYQGQKDIIEQYKQKIYTLSNEKKLQHNLLQDELQLIRENYDQELAETNKKNSTHIKDLQNRLTEAEFTIVKLELENEQLKIELRTADNQQVQNFAKLNICNQNDIIVPVEQIEYFEKLEIDFNSLKNELEQVRFAKSELSSKFSQLQNELDEIKEYYDCSQQNLEQKTDELNEAQNIIDSLQEKLIEVENELLSYKTSNVDHNKKGNSLFAEVDDQRQHMRDILNRQNQQYQSMKTKYEQSASEISRLKLENADIINEIRECVNMFKNADKFQKSKLNEYIGFLKTEKNRLENELKLTQLEMDSLAKTHGINWVSSMFEFCDNKTRDLQLKLDSYGMKKCEAEGLYAQSQERAAKWRFEALKSRCVIMNREMLLEKHKINFEPKLSNIRQMVERQYNQNESPIIDDVPFFLEKSFRDTVCVSNPTSPQHDNIFESDETHLKDNWEEVKEIFDNFNSQTTQNNCKQNVPAQRDENTILMLPNECESHALFTSKFNIDYAKIGNCNAESTENKENVKEYNIENDIKVSTSFKSLTPSSSGFTQSPHSNDVTEKFMKPSQSKSWSSLNKDLTQITSSTCDIQNRIRQVNVEMFTVKLKAKKSPKSSDRNET